MLLIEEICFAKLHICNLRTKDKLFFNFYENAKENKPVENLNRRFNTGKTINKATTIKCNLLF